MIDVKHLQLSLDLVNGASFATENPLGTSFDLADVYTPLSSEKLISSRFYHSWRADDETAFAGKLGVWVVPTTKAIVFDVSFGGSANLPTRFRELTDADIGDALFFLIPADLEGRMNVPVTITLVCMN